MSAWLLIRTNGAMPPGGFVFDDPITGKKYHDLNTFFDVRVKQIIRDRLANHRLFTDDALVSFDHVARELSAANCARLGNNPLFCSNGLPPAIQPVAASTPPAGKVCRWCGSADLSPVYCPTCSSAKLTGWSCRKCGKESPI
jgi:hypothetical protein